MKKFALGLALGLLAAAPAFSETIDPLQSETLIRKTINEPGTRYTFYGSGLSNKTMKDTDLPGGEFVRVTATKGKNPYDAGGGYEINKPIKAGDVIFFAIYARAPNVKDGQTASMPGIGVVQNGAPYAPIAVADQQVTAQWNLYYASGKANADWPRGKAHVAMQLAADNQVIDLGPVFVLDLGPDYDIKTLPHN
jgi:opacity protein-like surface antigen